MAILRSSKRVAEKQAEIDSLRSEVERLRAALKPFADIGSAIHPDAKDGEWTSAWVCKVADFRTASRALEGK